MKLYTLDLKPINNIILSHFGEKPKQISILNGGDINQVFKVELYNQNLVIKLNNSKELPQLFEKEKKGLELLYQSNFIIPKPHLNGTYEKYDYLIMDYIETGTNLNWNVFGEKLAQLHQLERKNFGLDHNNYIGSLTQVNDQCNEWIEFYTNHRLLALTAKARDQGLFERKHCLWIEKLCQKLDELIPTCNPSLIHGDLWSGNLLADKSGQPVLIDPAVYYGHPEMDWAMLSLFGSYPEEAMKSYLNIANLEVGFEHRKEIHQLYPLLVHLLIFGIGYRQSILSVLKKFS